MNITHTEQKAKQFPQINIAGTNFSVLIFQIRLALIYIIKRILIILCILSEGERGGTCEWRLTSTVDSFIVAVVTISGPVAEFVEVNAFFCPDALYVVEGTCDHNLMRACGRKKKKQEGFFVVVFFTEMSRLAQLPSRDTFLLQHRSSTCANSNTLKSRGQTTTCSSSQINNICNFRR